MSDEIDDVEAQVRAARLTTTRDFDERVLAEAIAPRARWSPALRWAAGIAAAAALAGAVTAAATGWFSGRSDRPTVTSPIPDEPPIVVHVPPSVLHSNQPDGASANRVADSAARSTEETKAAVASDEAGPEVEEEPEPTTIGLGIPSNVDARATVREAPILARVRLSGVGKGGKGHRESLPQGTIEAIYKGDSSLVGRGVTIHRKRSDVRKSFLSWAMEGEASLFGGAGTIVMPLMATNVGIPEKGDLHLRIAFGERFSGTLVRSDLPVRPVSLIDEEILTTLRDDLVASLSATDAAVRRSSIEALRWWSGGGSIAPDARELWRDEATAKALLAAGHDEDAKVRLNVGWMVSPAAGEAGRDLLEDLLFDSDPMNRQSAVTFLRSQGGSAFLETVESVRDSKWDESLSGPSPIAAKLIRNLSGETLRLLKEHAQAAVRADIAWALGRTKPSPETSAALLAALNDPDFEVRRGAAHSLGSVGGEGVTDRLDGIPNTEDPRVQMVAALSQVRLGDKRGYAHLSRLLAGEDARAATQACTALARVGEREAVELLLAATGDRRPVVRGAAVLSLAEHFRMGESPERAAVEAAIARLAADHDDYVRAAARAARRRRAPKPTPELDPETLQVLKNLGYPGN